MAQTYECDSIDDIRQIISRYESETNSQFIIDYKNDFPNLFDRVAKERQVFWSLARQDESGKAETLVPFSGVPFMFFGERQLPCHFKQDVIIKTKELQVEGVCPAKLTIYTLAYFPKFMITSCFQKCRDLAAAKLIAAIRTIKCQHVGVRFSYKLRLPSLEEHRGHIQMLTGKAAGCRVSPDTASASFTFVDPLQPQRSKKTATKKNKNSGGTPQTPAVSSGDTVAVSHDQPGGTQASTAAAVPRTPRVVGFTKCDGTNKAAAGTEETAAKPAPRRYRKILRTTPYTEDELELLRSCFDKASSSKKKTSEGDSSVLTNVTNDDTIENEINVPLLDSVVTDYTQQDTDDAPDNLKKIIQDQQKKLEDQQLLLRQNHTALLKLYEENSKLKMELVKFNPGVDLKLLCEPEARVDNPVPATFDSLMQNLSALTASLSTKTSNQSPNYHCRKCGKEQRGMDTFALHMIECLKLDIGVQRLRKFIRQVETLSNLQCPLKPRNSASGVWGAACVSAKKSKKKAVPEEKQQPAYTNAVFTCDNCSTEWTDIDLFVRHAISCQRLTIGFKGLKKTIMESFTNSSVVPAPQALCEATCPPSRDMAVQNSLDMQVWSDTDEAYNGDDGMATGAMGYDTDSPAEILPHDESLCGNVTVQVESSTKNNDRMLAMSDNCIVNLAMSTGSDCQGESRKSAVGGHTQKQLSNHNNMNDAIRFLCSECHISCVSIDEYIKHLPTCTKTPVRARSAGALTEMKPPPKTPVRLTCLTCQKVFKHKATLSYHEKYMHSDKIFLCAYCPKQCKTPNQRASHEREAHTRSAQLQCTYCGRCFARPGALRRHELMEQGAAVSVKRKLWCTRCKLRFKSEQEMQDHRLEVHTQQLPYKCDQCWRGFNTDIQLLRHLNTHTSEWSWKCGVCSLIYKTKAHLAAHQKAWGHGYVPSGKSAPAYVPAKRVRQRWQVGGTGNIPTWPSAVELASKTQGHTFKCRKCRIIFKTDGEAMAHRREVHGRNLPYQCSKCWQSFSTYALLVGHSRRHVNEWNWKCEVCSRVFKWKRELYAHKKAHGHNYEDSCKRKPGFKRIRYPVVTEGFGEQSGSGDVLETFINDSNQQYGAYKQFVRGNGEMQSDEMATETEVISQDCLPADGQQASYSYFTYSNFTQ